MAANCYSGLQRICQACRSESGLRAMTFVGVFLCNMTFGLPGIYGNLMTYTDSYMKFTLGLEPDYCGRLCAGFYCMMWSATVTITKKVTHHVNERAVFIFSLLLLDVSMLASYWAVQHSVAALVITAGVLPGIAGGMSDAMSLIYFTKWATSRNIAMFTAVITTTSVGSMIITLIITNYINPWNFKATESTANRQYFKQPQVLERCPSIFLVLAGIDFGLHVIGMILVQERKPQNDADKDSYESIPNGNSTTDSLTKDGQLEKEVTSTPQDISTLSLKNGSTATEKDCLKGGQLVSSEETFSIRKVIFSKTFLSLWIGQGFGHFSFVSLDTYYKMFAQARLTNDHFLSLVGPAVQVCIFCGRVMWGALVDRFGVKPTVMAYLSLNVFFMSFLYFIPSFGEFPFIVYVSLSASVGIAVFGIYPGVVLLYYGPSHMTTVYGLSASSLVIESAFFPFISGALLNGFGWWAVFLFSGLLSLLALATTVLLLPH